MEVDRTPEQIAAARQLLAIKQASQSFPGFVSYLYPQFKRPKYQSEIATTLDLLEKDGLVNKDGVPVRNLLFTLPPRHAKSFFGTINFPAYLLARRPFREVMVASYNAALSATFGRQTREIVVDKRIRRAYPGFTLSRETRAVDFWKTQSKDGNGAYYGVGIGGTTVGRGANCLIKNTLVATPQGSRRVQEITAGDLVLTQSGPRLVVRTHCNLINEGEFIEIRTERGAVFTVTGEHPVRANGQWICADNLREGDSLISLADMPVRAADPEQEGGAVSGVLPERDQSIGGRAAGMFAMRAGIYAQARRRYEDAKARVSAVLRPCLLKAGVVFESSAAFVQAVRCAHSGGERGAFLFTGMQKRRKEAPECSFSGGQPLRLPGGSGAGVSTGVQVHSSGDHRTGWREVFGLRRKGVSARSPSQRRQGGQSVGKPGDGLQNVPQQAPQVRADFVRSVRAFTDSRYVYNLTVFEHPEFFAEGVLTHNCLIVDDPFKSRKEAESRSQRNTVWDFYAASLLSRRQPDAMGQPPMTIVIMQRWHPDDLVARIMDTAEYKRGEWMHFDYPALTEVHRSVQVQRSLLPREDPRYMPDVVANPETGRITDQEKTGQSVFMNPERAYVSKAQYKALWPERFSVEWLLQQKETIGPREFEALYQQKPYIIGGSLIRLNWFRRYNRESLPAEFHAMVVGVDTAFKKNQSNDYSVMALLAITAEGDIYVLRITRKKLEFPELKKQVVAMNASLRGKGLRGWYIEDKASGQSLIQELRKESGLAVIPWKPGSADKVERANSVTPLIEGGRVYLPETADWLEDFEEEVSAFPNGKHDDQVDGLVIALDVLSKTVVSGTDILNLPLGQMLAEASPLLSDLTFGGNGSLAPDPKGWEGGFGRELAEIKWKGFGE